MHFGPTEYCDGIFGVNSLRKALFSVADTDKLRELLLEIHKDGLSAEHTDCSAFVGNDLGAERCPNLFRHRALTNWRRAF
jgi:hypothetical protein